MSVVKFKPEKQKKLKTLSKIIEVVAQIAKVLCYYSLLSRGIRCNQYG